jgi:hypothetical protein
MRTASRSERYSRASGASFSLGDFASPIRAIVTRIKELSRDGNGLNSYNHNTIVHRDEGTGFSSPVAMFSTGVRNEVLIFGRKSVTVRRVYLLGAAVYKVAWVVDCDIAFCMICQSSFGWTRFRHHCRACGAIVCNKCSPYRTIIPHLNEDGGSRVCKSCFGLKPAALDSIDSAVASSSSRPLSPDAVSPAIISPKRSGTTPSTKGSSFDANHSRTPPLGSRSQVDTTSPQNLRSAFSAEKVNASEHLQKKVIASDVQIMDYETCYRRMRQLIPIDVQSRSNKKIMVEQGVPNDVASRIAATKALWLICMHPDDISMVGSVEILIFFIIFMV